MAQHSDIIVIGGGMAGMSVAAHLSAAASVTVLEMEEQPGFHSTGRSVATYIENYGSQVVRCLNRASANFLATPDDAFWQHDLLSPRGLLYFARNGDSAHCDAILEGARGIEEITVKDAVSRVPIFRADRLERALFEASAQDIDVAEMLAGYRRRLRANGGTLICSAPVTGLARSAGTWCIDAGSETHEAALVINASGAWADHVAGLAGLEPLGLQPKRRSVATVPMPDDIACAQWPICADSAEAFYFKPETGALLVSPADETPVDAHDAYADDMALAEGLDRFQGATTVEVARLGHTWGGLRTFSPDGSHVIGEDPRADGFFWLAGQGGYGIQSAEGAALAAAGLVLNKVLPDAVTATGLDASQIAPDRFVN